NLANQLVVVGIVRECRRHAGCRGRPLFPKFTKLRRNLAGTQWLPGGTQNGNDSVNDPLPKGRSSIKRRRLERSEARPAQDGVNGDSGSVNRLQAKPQSPAL